MTTTLDRPATPPPHTRPRQPIASPPAPRRNRTRMALGVVVLVMCVLGAVALYQRASNRVEVVAIRHAVPAGQVVTASDLMTVSIAAGTDLRTVDAASRDSVVGQIAAVALVPGSLLAPAQVSDGPRIPAGMALVGATLKPGQFPTGVQVGDTVLLVEAAAPSSAEAGGMPRDRGRATVMELDPVEDASTSIAASLLVPEAAASPIAGAGASGRLSVIVVGGS